MEHWERWGALLVSFVSRFRTLPDRVEIVPYANEYAFIYDDAIMENLGHKLNIEDRRPIIEEFTHDVAQTQASSVEYMLQGAKHIQAEIFTEMMAIDKERAVTTMEVWQRFVTVFSIRQRSEPFKGLDDYLPYCISDAGELFLYGLVTFAMGPMVPEGELDLCKALSRPAWEVLALTNDLYSWEEERDYAAKAGESQVVNAIWVLMQEHALTRRKRRSCAGGRLKTASLTRFELGKVPCIIRKFPRIFVGTSRP